jgi:hypothetical protein
MAQANPRRVLIASLAGIAAGVAHTKRTTIEEGLDEIRAELAAVKVKPATPAAADILTATAAVYASPEPTIDEWWYPDAFAFLVEAGADPQAARAMWAGRRT